MTLTKIKHHTEMFLQTFFFVDRCRYYHHCPARCLLYFHLSCFHSLTLSLSSLSLFSLSLRNAVANVQTLNLEGSAPLLPFPNFELLRAVGVGVEDTELYAGGETEATPDLFVELSSSVEVINMTSYQKALNDCLEKCTNLRAKTSVCAATIALYQICSLIQTLFSEILPFPPSRGEVAAKESPWYYTTVMMLADQRLCLQTLTKIMKEYVSASRSLDGESAE